LHTDAHKVELLVTERWTFLRHVV